VGLTKDEFYNIMKTKDNRMSKRFLDNFFDNEMYQHSMNEIICIQSIFPEKIDKMDFWNIWKPQNITGKCVCLSSNGSNEEYWGFEFKDDATIFKLIWS